MLVLEARTSRHVTNTEPGGTTEHESEEERQLVRTLDKNVSPHNPRDEGGLALVGLALQKLFSGLLGSEGESTHCVHDQVHPEHHDRVERSAEVEQCADKRDDERDAIHRELELKEAADVVEHAPAPGG